MKKNKIKINLNALGQAAIISILAIIIEAHNGLGAATIPLFAVIIITQVQTNKLLKEVLEVFSEHHTNNKNK